ncbi:MAG: sigma-70 family RNA polymerase sigma factor [Planctomycetota bacterium]|nr:sigma-70 family RNA polymerase sigma factor [Planctomycetota bacterium]
MAVEPATRPVVSTAELMQQCQGLVRSLAKQIHSTLPRSADLDDLIGYGQVGLAEAARVFNPDVNVKFSTFAYYRIRGAMFDGVSKMAWFRKPSAARARYERGANAVLEESSGETVEASNDVHSDARWLNDISRTLAVAYLTSQSRPLELEDDDSEDPAAATADRELSERLHDLVDRLPAEAQSLIRGVYFEGLSLQDAGARLGVSKSWASRLHSRILDRLGRELRRLGAD